jgi:hypothetical protein
MANIDSCTNVDTDFATAWSSAGAGEHFPDLQKFYGDFALKFPYTATVESDFSVIGWEKDNFQKA